MRLTLGRKLFFYTSVLLLGVLLVAFAFLEREQARQWQQHLEIQQISFARFATPELLKHFRGNFDQSGGMRREQLKGLLGFNPDLVKVSIYSPTGRLLFDLPALMELGAVADQQVNLDWASDALEPVSRPYLLPGGERLLEVVAPAISPSGSKMLQVRYLFSYGSVDRRLAEMHRTFLTIALIAALSALVLVAMVARRFTQPIKRLIGGVQAVARGELQTSIPTRGTDELAELGKAFNDMAANLQRKRQELEQKNQQLSATNAELQQVQERLLRSERLAAVGQVAAGVSHEIDNPVGIILGYAELLLEDFSPEDPRTADLRAIIEECHRCKKITGGLLGLARTSAQQWEEVDLPGLVQETVASLRPQKLFREISVHLPEIRLVRQLSGDSDRFRQILVNLLLNAAQALGGRGDIWIYLSEDGQGIRLEVHDNGPGIALDQLEQIFEPFFSTKERNTGTGLGLSVCRKLVEEHGGQISAGSSPHGGAMLWLVLPTL